MKRLNSLIITTAMFAAFVSTASAGFVTSYTRTSIDATLDRIDLYAKNTGGGTGTGLLALEMSVDAVSGSQSIWHSSLAGGPNILNTSETQNRSFVRIDANDASSSSTVSRTPAGNWPAAPSFGPQTVGIEDFGVVVAGLAGATPANIGQGALFSSLYVTKNFFANITGNLGGDAGAKVAFGINIHGDPVQGILPVPPTSVVFGQIVTNGAPFSVSVSVIGFTDPIQLVTNAVAGISNVTVTPQSGGSTAMFNVSGIVDYSLNGTTVVVPLIATDNSGGNATGSFTLIVTPEPGMLSVLAASGFARRRR